MGKPAARVSDMHTCPLVTGVVPHVGGPIIPPVSMNVMTGKLLQARVGDMLTCVGPPDVIAMGSPTVLVNKMLAARMGDMTAHGGTIIVGCFTVLIGESGGGGAGAPAQAGAGSSSASSMLSTAGAMIAPAQQAAVYKAAAKTGAAFCARCQS